MLTASPSRRSRVLRRAVALIAIAVPAACSTGDGTTLSPPNSTFAPTTTVAPSTSLLIEDSAGSLPLEGFGDVGESLPLDGITSVALIGDSLSVAAEEAIVLDLSARGIEVVAFDAQEGRRIAVDSGEIHSGLDAAGDLTMELAAAPPDVWVVALGTNDVGGQAEATSIERDTTSLLTALDAERLVWVDTYVEGRIELSQSTNAAIGEAISLHPEAAIASWYEVAPTDGYLVSDGVHLTDAGELGFADLIGDAVEQITS